ncbi:alpha-D-ribose 1-methylphosphonate 5-triphosphate diphosphatase [Thalassobius vesicularis]|uniref:Alpha-D-ribose 1-methylphosphonate 5-triphosphate diphosphatase n=1 Tax=Thalassobius vesicularis TaxID=1294297 RepID=A0A4S3MCP0_9RHOB|nr:alpha-D-ribose 1-methylphosphonate 5-triphosphate diphosphatase [Thalassobius vesicularis]THD76440.1 alpha-D-ribose 1-methylphosphonate 5-triphosphate diphosphatase [Thalassobius vesicularis]
MHLTLTNATILRPDGWAQDEITVDGAVLSDQSAPRRVDLSGFKVLPGIVDIHGDGFERHLAPRRGAMKDLTAGLVATEAELAANGITTATLAQFWSWEGGMRAPEFALRFLDALEGYAGLGTDLWVQLRLETHLLNDFSRFEDAVARYGVGFVVFNDHLPHEALAKGKRPPRLTGQALKSGRSPEAHLAMLQDLHARAPEVPAALTGLADRLRAQGVLIGSHDDRTAVARAEWRAMGVALSEFPETREAAEAARAAGDPVVLGAPNVVRGGSHSGNVSAAELVMGGIGDALASDYHYPAPRLAALALDRWDLVSSGPARVLGLADRGELMPGKRADLVVLDAAGRVGATIAGGRVTHLAGEVAARFLA